MMLRPYPRRLIHHDTRHAQHTPVHLIERALATSAELRTAPAASLGRVGARGAMSGSCQERKVSGGSSLSGVAITFSKDADAVDDRACGYCSGKVPRGWVMCTDNMVTKMRELTMHGSTYSVTNGPSRCAQMAKTLARAKIW